MAKVVKFDLTGTPAGVTSFYVRVTDTARTELFSGTANIVDDSVEIVVPEGTAIGTGVVLNGHNFSGSNESTFKVITGYAVVEEINP